jgi:hypothetical protein
MEVGIVALGALYGTGCLLPQEETVLQTLTLKNRPPRIDELNTTLNGDLARQLPIGNGTDCVLQFQALVEDPDIDDLLTARWYIDFLPNDPKPPIDEAPVFPTGKPARLPVTFNRDVKDTPQLPLGMHVITFMVFEGDLGTFEGPDHVPAPERLPDGGTNPRFTTTFNWAVMVEDRICPL